MITNDYIRRYFKSIVPSKRDPWGRVVQGRVIGWNNQLPYLRAVIVFPNVHGKFFYTVDPFDPLKMKELGLA